MATMSQLEDTVYMVRIKTGFMLLLPHRNTSQYHGYAFSQSERIKKLF